MITNLDDDINIKQLAQKIVSHYVEKNYTVEWPEGSTVRQKIQIKKGSFRGRDLTIEMERKANGLEIRVDKEKLIVKMIPGAVGIVELIAFLPAAAVVGGTVDTAVATASSASIITDILAATSVAAPVLVPVAIGVVLIGVTIITFLQQSNFRRQVFLDIKKLIYEMQQEMSLYQDFLTSQVTQPLQQEMSLYQDFLTSQVTQPQKQEYLQRKMLLRVFCLCTIFVLLFLISTYFHLIPQEYTSWIPKNSLELGKVLELVEDQIAGSFWINVIGFLTFIITVIVPLFAKYRHSKRGRKKV